MSSAINLGTVYASLDLRLNRLEANMAKAKSDFDKLGNDIGKRADKIKQDLGTTLGDMGRTLALGVTAPLVALGTAAIKTAVQMDSLKRGLNAVTGSTEETGRQLKRLEQVAKLPGLSFEAAVRGSINLQAAGLSAEKAEGALRGFGNALATVGKGSTELSGVILALTQIAAKGKVSAEEINQLQERLPQIRTLMRDAFGTSDTERLAKLGVGSDEFLTKIIAQLDNLPKATGGIANAFENVQDSARRALTAIGDVMLPTVGRAVEFAAGQLEAFATGWRNLPSMVQNAILGAGGVAASLGAIALGLSGVIKLAESLRGAFVLLGPILSNPYVLAGVAVAALAAGLVALLSATKDETQAATDAARAEKAAADARAENAQKTQTLIGEYETLATKTNRTKEESARLQEVLNEISKRSPELVTGYNEQGQAVGLYADALARITKEHIAASRAAEIAMFQERALNAQRMAENADKLREERKIHEEALKTGTAFRERFITRTGGKGAFSRERVIDRVPATPQEMAWTAERMRQIDAELAGTRNAQRGAQGFPPLGGGPAGRPRMTADEALTSAGRLVALRQRLDVVTDKLKKLEALEADAKTNTDRNRIGRQIIGLSAEKSGLELALERFDPKTASDKRKRAAEATTDAEIELLERLGKKLESAEKKARQDRMKELAAGVPDKIANANYRAAMKKARQEIAKEETEDWKKGHEERLKIEEIEGDVFKANLERRKQLEEYMADARQKLIDHIRDEAVDATRRRMKERTLEEIRLLEEEHKKLVEAARDLMPDPSFGGTRKIGPSRRKLGLGSEFTESIGTILRGRESDETLEKSRNRLKRTFGGMLGQEIAYSFADGFAKHLDKAFGKTSIGKVFSRALIRYIDKEMDEGLDRLFDSIGKIVHRKKDKAEASASGGIGNSLVAGGMPGGFPGGYPGGFPGQKGTQWAALAAAMGMLTANSKRKQQNAGLGSLLGMGAAALIPGGMPFMALGGALGGLLGGLFAEGGHPPVGRWSLVGEKGPELIMPKSQMTVVPAGPTAQMLGAGGGSGGVTVNMGGVTIANDMDLNYVARRIAREVELKSYARPGR